MRPPTRSGWSRPTRRRRSALVRQALDETRRIWIRYYTASRDAVTERTVDPLRLLVTDGHSYLEAYCHLAGAIRHFRVDRIEEVRLLDEPAQATLWVDSDIPERIFHPDPQIPPVTLTLTGGARWVAEYYPMEEITELAEPAGCAAGADARRQRRVAGPAGALARRRRGDRGPARNWTRWSASGRTRRWRRTRTEPPALGASRIIRLGGCRSAASGCERCRMTAKSTVLRYEDLTKAPTQAAGHPAGAAIAGGRHPAVRRATTRCR